MVRVWGLGWAGVAGFAAMIVVAVAAAEPARAASNCEAIQNPFQYNECLAKQAPGRAARGGRRAGGTGGADPETSVPARRRHTITPGLQDHSGVTIRRSTGRRVSATIDPWAGARSAGPTKKRRR